MTRISRLGFSVEVLPGWDVELIEHPGGRVVAHFSNSPLPELRSDFGGHALESIPLSRVFMAVLEYDPAEANVGLFQSIGIPRFFPRDFAPNRLHRYVAGQVGAQKFFSESNRTFCSYVVVTSTLPSVTAVGRINQVLSSIRISPID